jgi:hypothetical protein
MVIKPGLARNLSGNRSGQVALKWEQQDQLESKLRNKLSHRKEGEAKHKHCKHNPQKRNGGTPVGNS